MLEPFLRAGILILVIIVLTRIQGLRSFSKMSIFDFVLTIATGSLVATAIVDRDMDIEISIASVVAIFAFQGVIAWVRVRFSGFRKTVDNTPLILMEGQTILHENLKAARVTEADLFAKLREANVWNTDQVIAVILETTGDVSVLHDQSPVPMSAANVFDSIRETVG